MPRQSEYPICELILKRNSSDNIMPGSIDHEDLMSLFEAAKWAPSSYNSQPWRFIYTTCNDEDWNNFLELLAPSNKAWAKNSGVLIILISRKYFEYNEKLSFNFSFDAGAAWENLALQATALNLIAHAIGGFDYSKARKLCNIPEIFSIECMIAVSKKSSDEDNNQNNLTKRKKLSSIVFKNKFKV